MSSKHLIIPDSHAHPDYHNERFTWLGKLIHDVKPDVVINIGDMADMASLCFHSKKSELENARYQRDCSATIDAQDRIFHEVRKHKKKQPRWIWTLGNHDIRPERYVAEFPIFEGKLKNEDIGYNLFPWEVYPFLEPVDIDGIDYAHYFPSGVMGRPIGGIHPSYAVIKKRHKSATSGHSHIFDYKVERTPGRSVMGLSVGCYIDYDAGYAGESNDMWSRGIVIKDNVEDGLYDIQWISLDKIKKEYG